MIGFYFLIGLIVYIVFLCARTDLAWFTKWDHVVCFGFVLVAWPIYLLLMQINKPWKKL